MRSQRAPRRQSRCSTGLTGMVTCEVAALAKSSSQPASRLVGRLLVGLLHLGSRKRRLLGRLAFLNLRRVSLFKSPVSVSKRNSPKRSNLTGFVRPHVPNIGTVRVGVGLIGVPIIIRVRGRNSTFITIGWVVFRHSKCSINSLIYNNFSTIGQSREVGVEFLLSW